MENSNKLLYLDNSKIGLPSSSKHQLCLNFQIKKPDIDIYYSFRLFLQNSNHNELISIGNSPAQNMDTEGNLIFEINFIIDYYFEKKQKWFIELAKSDGKFIKWETFIGIIVGNKDNTWSLLIDENKDDYLEITGRAMESSKEILNFDIQLLHDFGNVYYVLKKMKYSSEQKHEFFPVYKSENSSLKFNTALIPSSYIDYGDHNKTISWDLYVDNSFISSKEMTVNQICNGSSRSYKIGDFEIIIDITKSINSHQSFLDLINKNLELNLEIGIDFTGSNGDYRHIESLHYLSENCNWYESAIRECGTILANYDSDKIYPVFGFGAIIKGKSGVNHCFPWNLCENEPGIKGIEEVITAYKEILPKLIFAGPTNFEPIIRATIKRIKNSNKGLNYYILLILTDGEITDMQETIEAIIDASSLPLSIIIVGIGDADFSKMTRLDGDDIPLNINGKTVIRDIVQFVQFSDVANDPQKLAEEVLAELPQQIEYYFNK
ncbi:MAG: VWA domain-containing protein, partial [Mycoplasma sp.]